MNHVSQLFLLSHVYKQKLPAKRPNLPPELFNMKELPPGGEEEDDEDEQQDGEQKTNDMDNECKDEEKESTAASEFDMEPSQADETQHDDTSDAGRHCSRSPKGQCATKADAGLMIPITL